MPQIKFKKKITVFLRLKHVIVLIAASDPTSLFGCTEVIKERDNFTVDYKNGKEEGSQFSQHTVAFKMYGNLDR